MEVRNRADVSATGSQRVCYGLLAVCYGEVRVCYGLLGVCYGEVRVCYGQVRVCFAQRFNFSAWRLLHGACRRAGAKQTVGNSWDGSENKRNGREAVASRRREVGRWTGRRPRALSGRALAIRGLICQSASPN